MKYLLAFLGRCCLSIVFTSIVVHHILEWDMLYPRLISVLNDWDAWMVRHPPAFSHLINTIFTLLRSHATWVILIGLVCLGLGGVSVFLGGKKLGPLLLSFYLIPEMVIGHAFWLYTGYQKALQTELFLNHLGIFGGVLILASCLGGDEV